MTTVGQEVIDMAYRNFVETCRSPSTRHIYKKAQSQIQGTNFTQLFSTNKEFQVCLDDISQSDCFPVIDVLYQDPTLLVLSSDYVDTIWKKGVAQAKREGYQIDAMTSFAVSRILPSGTRDVNLLVAMSKPDAE
ncbi:MAG: hypothetical protein M3297_02010 [Thermoproteota archaeon]|nr:hypothetical protein [Thermoproteota archaeon]